MEKIRTRPYRIPRASAFLMEMSLLVDVPTMYLFKSLIAKGLPKGDGHPVLVLPGFASADRSTANLRALLTKLGYNVRPWGLGKNNGLCDAQSKQFQQNLIDFATDTGNKVSLVGWSGGGVYARIAAHENHKLVRQVITLGCPLFMDFAGSPDSTFGRLFRKIHQDLDYESMLASDFVHQPPPVPTTSLIGAIDRIMPSTFSVELTNDITENIIVPASHLGLAHNIFSAKVIADRLAQDEDSWKPFEPRCFEKAFYTSVCAREHSPHLLV